MTTEINDRIEKLIVLTASPERVWRAISDPREFGAWFGVDFLGQTFVPGVALTGKLTDPPEYAGMDFNIEVAAVDPPRMIAFRWHPFAGDPDYDYSQEPMTLIEFVLRAEGSGTRLTVTESGFAGIPAERRSAAFEMNSDGWQQQVERIARYVDG